jgi:Protein of unknown function (DUF1173)
MSALRILEQTITKADPRYEALLARCYQAKQRPQCLCISMPVAMYISKVGETFCLKRMPNMGPSHAPFCESYEPPAELSGLGDVLGAAIVEDVETDA